MNKLIPSLVLFEHTINQEQKFSHAGDQGDDTTFSGGE